MARRWFLAAAAACIAASSEAAVVASIALPEDAAALTVRNLEKTEPILSRLLADGAHPARGPFVGPGARYERLSPTGLRADLPDEEKAGLLASLVRLWGPRFRLEEVPAPAPTPARRPAVDRKAQSKRLAARLDVGASIERQNLFYDGSRNGAASAVAAVAAPASRHEARPAAPAPRPAAKPLPPPAPARTAEEGVSWGRAGVEVLKGAGETVRSIFTWQGLATAAAAVAIVTVAPVAVYGFLAVGAAVGGYTVGKALYDGYQAHRAGDAKGVYAASREFGKGALTLGLSLYGARHTPANLKPHLPKAGEFRALLSSMDDEAVVATTLAEKIRGK